MLNNVEGKTYLKQIAKQFEEKLNLKNHEIHYR